MLLGAVNMSIDYDDVLSRFKISDMSTPMIIGNGSLGYYNSRVGIVNDPEDTPVQGQLQT